MSWGADKLGVTQETFDMIKAATSGIISSTDLAGINLQPLVSLVPVDTPFFNSTPRVASGEGALFAYWQAILNQNSVQVDVGVPLDQAAGLVQIANQYIFSPFAAVGLGGTVTQDAIAQAQGYADALAVATLETIKQVLIGMDIHQLGAQSFALPTIGTVTLAASTTGGTIAASTAVHVVCAARSGVNYYRGGSAAASSDATLTTGSSTSTNSVTATVPAVKGAVAYDWYVGTTTGNRAYWTTTTVNTVVITFVSTAAQNVPALAGIFNSGLAGPSGTGPTADSSFQTYWQNGLLASILGDFSAQPDALGISGTVANLVTPGSGTSQGAYFKSLDGASLHVVGAALGQIDTMNQAIYDTYQLTPTRLLMGSQSINDIANAVLNNPQAVTWLVPTDREGRAQVVAGGAVAVYLNKTVNGKPIVLELQPHLPPGIIVAVVDEVPFPGANIDTVLSVETQYDFWRFDYGANRVAGATGGPRYDYEIRSKQAFRNKAAPVMGVLANIAAGTS
jgi:hypothetical protein